MNLVAVHKINKYGQLILGTEYFETAMGQTHHGVTTVGDHSLHVAYYSLLICALLVKLGISISERELVRASLCHDLGILGRYDKYRNNRECCRRHPIDSGEVARDILPDLSEKERDAITHHMWPLNLHRPHSKEGWIITVADKMAATNERMMPTVMRKRDMTMAQKLSI